MALLTLLLSHSMSLLNKACKAMLSWRAVLHFVAATGSSQCLHSCNIFCIKNCFGTAATLSVGTMKQSREVSVTEERLEMPGHSSSQLFRYFQNNFSGFYFWVSAKKSLLLVWSFCFSVSGGCDASPVPRRVKQCMKYHNYPKGGSPWGDLTAQFRSAETLSYFQLVLKIIQ